MTVAALKEVRRHESESAEHAPLATAPVLGVAGLVAVVLLLTSGRYGYFADELYFVAAGNELSWGYADQPPLVPLIARVLNTLFPGSLVALRVPAILTIAAGVILVALIARELGGHRRAQLLAGAAWGVSFHAAAGGRMLTTWMFDSFLWTVVLWLLVRWTRQHSLGRADDRLLLWAGVATALAMQTKLLIPALWVVLSIAVAFAGPRELFRRLSLWWGGILAAVSAVPTLVWQAANGWPQLEMGEIVAAENWEWYGGLFLPLTVGYAGGVGAFLVCFGLWRLLRSPDLRAYRYLGWTVIGVACVFMVSGGRPYYGAGLYGLLFAVATVEWQRRAPVKRDRWVIGVAYLASGVLAVGTLPIWPVSAIPPYDLTSRASLGWSRLESTVAEVYHRHPPESTAVLTHDYSSASAISHYGPRHGIARAYSASRGFWYFGSPPETVERAVYLGADRRYLEQFFNSVRPAATVDTNLGVETVYEGTPVWVVAEPKQSWSRLWPRLRHMNLGT